MKVTHDTRKTVFLDLANHKATGCLPEDWTWK